MAKHNCTGRVPSTCRHPLVPPSSVSSLFVKVLGAFHNLNRSFFYTCQLLPWFLNVTPVTTLIAAAPSAEQDVTFGCSGQKTSILKETQEDSSELSANKWSCDVVLHSSSEHSPRCQRSPLTDGETWQTTQRISSTPCLMSSWASWSLELLSGHDLDK